MLYFRLTSRDAAPHFGSYNYDFLIKKLEIVEQGEAIFDTIGKYFSGRGSLTTCEDVESNPGPGDTTDHGRLENLKDLLSISDQMDIIQLKHNLNRFGVMEVKHDSLEQLRLLMKKVLLDEILKFDIENLENLNYYKKCREETSRKIKSRQNGYECCFSGCRFQAARHRSFISHLKQTHPRARNIKCNFKKICLRVFDKIDDLISHVIDDHSSLVNTGDGCRAAASVDIPCSCNLHSCGSQHFRNAQELMTHINTFHHLDQRQCIFEECDQRFQPSYNSRNHFRRKHINMKKMKLKTVHILNPMVLQNVEQPTIDFTDMPADVDEDGFCDNYDMFDVDHLERGEEEENEESEQYFLEYYADFLNRLVHEKFIPQTTVQDIADEYYENTKKAKITKEKALRQSLGKISSISQDSIDDIVKEVLDEDCFLKAQEQLQTQYKRTKYVRENMQYVAPIEILLNKSEVKRGEKKDVIHYIPLIDTIKNLLEDRSVIKMLENYKSDKKSVIADIMDGSCYKSNPFFQDNENTMGLILYSDGVELKVNDFLKLEIQGPQKF